MGATNSQLSFSDNGGAQHLFYLDISMPKGVREERDWRDGKHVHVSNSTISRGQLAYYGERESRGSLLHLIFRYQGR